MSTIVFGTDGWRGLIARDYTFDNVRLVAHATARYVVKQKLKSPSVIVGYDTRFLSREFAVEAATVLAGYDITVYLTDDISTTPQVSFHTKAKAAALGVVITASHNPPLYNGYKLKATFGGPAIPEQIAAVEAELAALKGAEPKKKMATYEQYVKQRLIRPFDAKDAYIKHIAKKIDLDLIRKSGIKMLYDPMHGAGINFMHRILPGVAEIHGEYNPSFGEVDHPEPIAECLEPLMTAVKKGKYAMGLATDGDADRLGAVDHTGAFVDSHRIFVLLMKYLYEDKKRKGGVAKTVSLTSMVNAYCEKKGITLYETPVGMKHIAKLMQETPIVIGGEESGGLATSLHIPERDGIFNGLLLLEMMAAKKKTLKQLCDELDQEFGTHRYRRRDVHMTEERKRKIMATCAKGPKKIGKYAVQDTNTKDGYKFYVDGGWLLIRASGTEPLLRFYAEAKTLTMVNELLDAGLEL